MIEAGLGQKEQQQYLVVMLKQGQLDDFSMLAHAHTCARTMKFHNHRVNTRLQFKFLSIIAQHFLIKKKMWVLLGLHSSSWLFQESQG